MCFTNTLFVTASLLMTLTFLAVGISFFGPYWISNLGSKNAINETQYADPKGQSYLPGNKTSIWKYPNRGLWAQCGHQCFWFWSDDFRLQTHLLTPLGWHLATQVLYAVAAVMILFTEIMARVQICCNPQRKTRYLASIGIIVIVSALLQLGALVAFGIGSSNAPYNSVNPDDFSDHFGVAFDPQMNPIDAPYLGWCYWMAVVGDAMSILTGSLFLLAAWCNCCAKAVD